MYVTGLHSSKGTCNITLFLDHPEFEPRDISKCFKSYFVNYTIPRIAIMSMVKTRKFWMGPAIYSNNNLTGSMLTPNLNQIILKSKYHLIFIIYKIYI